MRTQLSFRRLTAATLAVAAVLLASSGAALAKELRLDFATYSPVSLILKERKILETALAKDGVTVRWVQSAGSNKALEFLNAGSLDIGSTAGAAALLGRINGNPIKSVYVYSKPEWTALVAPKGSPIKAVADLKGKRVAVTRGTDPHIFLVRALQDGGLGARDVQFVLLQHADGRLALARGDVDAWAGLDPLMAQAEIEDGATLFHRDADKNTYGVLNVREAFLAEQPALVERVIAAYEEARAYARANKAELVRVLAAAARIDAPIAERQLSRTDLTKSAIGDVQRKTIEAAGVALQKAGVIEAGVDVAAAAAALVDTRFSSKLAVGQ